ncbi:MAG: TVP38/TMEM64 family protein, partial [Limibaculum sp.]
MSEPAQSTTPKSRHLGRMLPAAVLVAGLVLFFVLDLDRYFDLEMLQEHRNWLMDRVDEFGLLAILLYTLLYMAMTAFSIPLGGVLTIAAGFFFGTLVAASCAVIGGTLGAIIVFLAARTAVGELLRAKAGSALERMEAGFRENAFNYLLMLRLIPIFPFWLINLVPAFLGMPLRSYAIATFVGVIPGAMVFASLGNGLGAILDAGGELDLGILLKPAVLFPLLALAVLALLPV